MVHQLQPRIKTFAVLSRSTRLQIRAKVFHDFFPTGTSAQNRLLVWKELVDRPPWLDLVLVSPQTYPKNDPGELITFDMHPALQHTEPVIHDFLEQGMANGKIHLHFEELLAPSRDSLVVDCIVDKCPNIATCSVIIHPYNPFRERMIRWSVAERLRQQGNNTIVADEQAQQFPIISLASIHELVDAARWHLILVDAHELGTMEHAQWIQWAEPLFKKKVLRQVHLISAPEFIGSCRAQGLSVAYHLHASPMASPGQMKGVCESLLPSFRLRYILAVDWIKVFKTTTEFHKPKKNNQTPVKTITELQEAKSTPVLFLSRRSQGVERTENIKFSKAGNGKLLLHCALFDDEFLLGFNSFLCFDLYNVFTRLKIVYIIFCFL